MLKQLAWFAALWLSCAQAAFADVLRFEGAFDTRYDCLGSRCGDAGRPISISPLPFAFTLDVTTLNSDATTKTSTQWTPPGWPATPPLSQATFDSFVDRLYRETHVFHTNQDPLNRLLLWSGSLGHHWSGTDRQGIVHGYSESLGANLVGSRTDPSAPIAFTELTNLFDEYLASGRELHVMNSFEANRRLLDGTFEGTDGALTGAFRLTVICRAPSAVATLRSRLGL